MKKMLYLVLILVGVIAALGGVLYTSPSAQDLVFKRAITAVLGRDAGEIDGLRVVVCGSASPLGNDPSRAQACIAVLTPEHFFLFDVGARSPVRIAQAALPMARLDGVFLTHFHSDHIAGLPDVNLASWVQGRTGPLQVYGPTGVASVVNGLNSAYALDRSYRTAHHGAQLLAPDRGYMQPNTFNPGTVVWQDAEATVTAFPVSHPPIEPAVGFRVDYRGRSVVISGDTNAADSLFEAAEGADLLLHDALSRTLLDPMIAAATELEVPVLPRIMTDVIDYHADASTLPERVAAAGIQQLVLYHMVPVPPNALAARIFLRDLPDGVILANDLHTFDLPPDSTEIRISEP
ncbi:MAG: MBL fold metallo-hydrolase [Pseudomonadota bacterium]